MRRLLDLPFLVILMGLAGLAMLLPAFHAVILRDYTVARGFFYSGIIVLMLVGMIAIATLNFQSRNAARSHLSALAGAYIVLPVLLALPLTQMRLDIGFGDAWFEMLSDFTTTGATLFAPQSLPPSVHLWRALVGWLGGFFIVLMAVAVLAPMNLGGAEVATGRGMGRGATGTSQITKIADPSQRIARYAMLIFPVYAGLTTVLWVGLILAGDAALVALCHAMATLSTSGISPIAGLQASASGVLGEVLIFVFLLTVLTRRSLAGAVLADQGVAIWQDPELRLGLIIVAVCTLALFFCHWIGIAAAVTTQPLRAFWGGAFVVLSYLTTTGFESTSGNWAMAWAGLKSPGLVLMGLAIMGGGVATTAGGVKLLRIYALYRHGERELERLIHPNSVGGSGHAARKMRREGAYVAWVFFMLFGLSIAFFCAALTFTGMAFEPALIFVVSCLTTTGPLAENLPDVYLFYRDLDGFAQIILGAAMVVGRLETLAILALLAPDSWRR